MFLSQNSADAYQVYETAPFPVHTYQTCAASIRDTNATAYWLYIRGTIAGSLTRFVVDGAKRAQDGLFMPALTPTLTPTPTPTLTLALPKLSP